MIITGGKDSTNPPWSDIYSTTLAPAHDQGFVNGSEDMIIKQALPMMFVRPMVVVEGSLHWGDSYQSEINVHSAPSVFNSAESRTVLHGWEAPVTRYTVDVENIEFSLIRWNPKI